MKDFDDIFWLECAIFELVSIVGLFLDATLTREIFLRNGYITDSLGTIYYFADQNIFVYALSSALNISYADSVMLLACLGLLGVVMILSGIQYVYTLKPENFCMTEFSRFLLRVFFFATIAFRIGAIYSLLPYLPSVV